MNLLETLRSAFAAATPEGGDPSAFSAAVRPSTDPKFGDYQANGCMALAKALKANPRDLAAQVAARVDLSPMADKPEVAGPGFLNVRLKDDWLAEAVRGLLDDENLGLEPPLDDQNLKVVIDYSSPNVAKPMHVGHIRSTVIGESLARLFEALGHDVIRDNHLGDWGSQFGMILWGWKNERNEAAYNENPVGELARLYRSVASQIKTADDLEEQYAKVFAFEKQGKQDDAEALFNNLYDGTGLSLQDVHAVVERGRRIEAEARAETAKLHANDGENRALWGQFMPHCLAALGQMYDRLDVSFDVQLGESFYDDMLAGVVKSLQDRGLAVESEGALVVFSEGQKAPFIVRKRDGAYNYATTDLATIQYRVETWHPDLILYVVDTRQSDHFKALFDVARRWGFDEARYEHVAFGTILGADRRPYKTRSGDTVGLESLLDEAVAKALQVVQANSPELDAEEQTRVSEIVGLGAIKYADLSQNRLSDYIFDFEKMMALNGNTATYMQYAYARIRSIFRRGNVDPATVRARKPAILLSQPAERALALGILRLPETLQLAASELKPNIVTDYLFSLANAFSTFFEECPVLKAESDERRDSRLALCDLTARTLKLGLGLLGIDVVERM
ncbi:MAG TPA: arginine--tRNA ligase [Isosphaeraceae bacterium]|nr:arginine--tRNA ligase [Isosphaeraceae bacterium]